MSLGLAFAGALAGCQPGPEAPGKAAFEPVYLGIETRLLDRDLVDFRVRMRGARDRADVAAYADCAAAGYTLIRGFGFARHVRTEVQERDGLWRGDAVYTISSTLPAGLLTIDAKVVAANCAERGIPTV